MNSEFFRALCEPVRIDIFLFFVKQGRSDVGSVAASFSQNRSVISRHLQILERAGILASEKEGRHVYYDIESETLVRHLESLARQARALITDCC